MENSTLPTFARQFFVKTIITLIAICGLLVWSSLWFDHDQQHLTYQVTTELPNNQLALKNMQLQRQLAEQIQLIKTRHQGGDIDQQHQHLVTLAQQWQLLFKPSRTVLDTLNSFDTTLLNRIDQTAKENEAIRQQALSLLSATQTQLIATRQEIITTELSTTQDVLLQYINALLADIRAGLNELSLQTTNIRFEQLSLDVNHLLNAHASLAKLDTLTLLDEQIGTLEQLFISEQRLIGKWRGSIRLFSNYDDFLTNTLTPALAINTPIINEDWLQKDSLSLFNRALHAINIQLGKEQVSMLLVGLFIGNVCWVLFLVWSFKRAAKEFLELLHASVDGAIAGKLSSPASNISADINQIIEKIIKISQPQHNEEEYQALADTVKQQHKVMSKLGKIASWTLSPKTGLTIDKNALIDVTLSPDINQSSLRHVLSKEQSKHFIDALRAAKQLKQVKTLPVTLLSGTSVEVTILYLDHQWQGTVAEYGRVLELEQTITKEQNAQQSLAHEHHQQSQKAFDKIAEMLVQAMLQSQNMALISGVSIQASYRPLARMFEWVRQQHILSEMAYDSQPKTQQDALLADEIYCAVFNAQSEAKLQQNTLFLQCDENLATQVRLDVRLFGRLISAFCQLALKEQFKSKLHLVIEAIDQNSGQQSVKFTAKVSTSKPLSKLPAHANWLLSSTEGAETLAIETYFYTLLRRLHGEHVAAELTEAGYTLSFDLPIAISTQSKAPIAKLQARNILVLSSNKEKQKVIKRYLKQGNCQVEGLAQVSRFAEQFNLAHLTRNKLDLVVFVQHQIDDLSEILQHINSLPDERKPKLVVLQQSHVGGLNKTGLFSLAAHPVSRESLISTCEHMLKSTQITNQILPAQTFAPFHYSASQVELLLAVQHPHQHQPLIMLLQWLGFNIKLVCHGKGMQKHWQSGRYLVLINEFEHSPVVQLATGKLIARGVFHLTDNTSEAQKLALSDEDKKITKYWHVDQMPEIDQLKSLVKLLSPWLKVNTEQSKSAQQKRVKTEQAINESKRQNILFDSSTLEQLPQAFALEKFAQHQGSGELAAYMLDTYIDNIAAGIEAIEGALFEANYHLLAELFDEVSLMATILSAQGLMEMMLQLKQADQNKAFDKMDRLLEQVKAELTGIRAYANAI